MSAADLAMYYCILESLSARFSSCRINRMIQKGMSGFIRYQSVIDIEPEITDSVDAVNMKHPDGISVIMMSHLVTRIMRLY